MTSNIRAKFAPSNPEFTLNRPASQPSPRQRMLQMTDGFRATQLVGVAAKLKIADLLVNGPLSAPELADATGANVAALYRVLRALAGIGVLDELVDERFGLTDLGATLRSDGPASLSPMAELAGSEQFWRAWSKLHDAVFSGDVGFNEAFGMSAWEYRAENPQEGLLFDNAMTVLSQAGASFIVNGYDYSDARQIVDVGGGHGELLCQILQANKSARGTVLDLPSVVVGARERIGGLGLSDRCEASGINFFEDQLPSADIYLLKAIIHDLDDERAVSVLKNLARSMTSESRVLIVEVLVPPFGTPSPALVGDVHMMVMVGGAQRTAAQHSALLSAAGLKLEKVIEPGGAQSIVEARLN